MKGCRKGVIGASGHLVGASLLPIWATEGLCYRVKFEVQPLTLSLTCIEGGKVASSDMILGFMCDFLSGVTPGRWMGSGGDFLGQDDSWEVGRF